METINKINCVLIKIPIERLLLINPEEALEIDLKEIQEKVGCKLYI